ncbi:histamine H2 receptor-like [Anneissia japonica]|uniref:histamine H2 receptor-like n=1 Tax=Anneissia japonica TaxID=1529436 RepID=UPI0014257515|nr:histamine H2 receptor-like [Anneissia japonica]
MAERNTSIRPTTQMIGLTLMETSMVTGDYETTIPTDTAVLTRSVGLGILFTIIIILIIFGNLLVCLSPWVNIMLRTATYTLLVSLAMVDLLLGLTVLPFSAIFTIAQTWKFGPVFCNIYVSCDVLFCTASILHLLVISLDRYVAIVKPFTYKNIMSRSKAFLGIGVVWSISFLISFLPIHLGWNTESGHVQSYSNPSACQLETNTLFALVDGILLFFVPLILMCCLYCKIVLVARNQAKAISRLSAQFNNNRKHHIKVVDEHKALKVMAIVMGCFVVCWVPYFTLFTFGPVFNWNLDDSAYFVVLWMGYVNSMINPLVYAAINSEFRKAFSILIYMAKNRTSDRRLSNGSMVTLRVNADRNDYERVERNAPSVCWDPTVDDINIPLGRNINGLVYPIVAVQTSNERNTGDSARSSR